MDRLFNIYMKEIRTLKQFSWAAILEGCSYLAFALTMPLKYGYDILWPNKIVGLFHGILFIIYVYLAYVVVKQNHWSFKRFVILFVASLVPFGTFYIDHKYIKPLLQF